MLSKKSFFFHSMFSPQRIDMWANCKLSKTKTDQEEVRGARKSLNVDEEYVSALRTKSFSDFSDKFQLLVNTQLTTFPSFSQPPFSETFLEPCQETISLIFESSSAPIFSKNPEIKRLLLKYFDISAEASEICSHLLKSVNQTRFNYRSIQQALHLIDTNRHHEQQRSSVEQFDLISSKLNTFASQINPLSDPNKNKFELIHKEYSSFLHHLKSKRKKVTRVIKLIKFFRKTCGICVTATCSLVAIVAMVLAAHTLTAILMGPAILSFPYKRFKKKVLNLRFLRVGILEKIGEQLDVAAKGTYILDRDFDTMSRSVARLHDEIERNKSIIQFSLQRKDDRFSLHEILKDLKKNDLGFRKQVEELEEHVFLCLVTINRARALVINEMKTPSLEE